MRHRSKVGASMKNIEGIEGVSKILHVRYKIQGSMNNFLIFGYFDPFFPPVKGSISRISWDSKHTYRTL